MDRVEEAAERYLTMWNEQYALVNDSSIVAWAVLAAMQDIEWWVQSEDPNGANAANLSPEEARQLYRILAPSASFFNYSCRAELLPDTS